MQNLGASLVQYVEVYYQAGRTKLIATRNCLTSSKMMITLLSNEQDVPVSVG